MLPGFFMNDMIVFVVIVILLIPVFLQMKYGVKSAAGRLKISHFLLTCLFMLLEIIIAVMLFFLLIYFDAGTTGVRCGLGLAGLAFFAFPIFLIIILIAVFQRLVVKRD